ncbi:helix-turn-helix transcriptional regulator [Parabacteroides distasonis]|mgnify:FL=1|jgi:transcriptional regulator with XRE-family HTH domain|uniref:helix-turn-helix domain-containing protein n=1 Tax=Parabacteroides distasonis TaxID=823 RepID=UPI001C391DE6|nr:helix-turn-helix transcriptional regulator [Parabacteroides distasonis]MBV4225843.1 helix-turn-helix transcriptional regulator [Parabacteroides distasonis]
MNIRVKEICKEQGITIGELADKMQMVRESLSRAINGNPTLETLEKIANALGVPVTELFEKPSDGKIVGFVKVGDTVHEMKSAEDVKDLAGKL